MPFWYMLYASLLYVIMLYVILYYVIKLFVCVIKQHVMLKCFMSLFCVVWYIPLWFKSLFSCAIMINVILQYVLSLFCMPFCQLLWRSVFIQKPFGIVLCNKIKRRRDQTLTKTFSKNKTKILWKMLVGGKMNVTTFGHFNECCIIHQPKARGLYYKNTSDS